MTKQDETRLMGYRIEMYPDEDGSWAAEIPELAGCAAGGVSPDEAVINLEDALEAWMEAAHADGRAVPPPAKLEEEYSGRFLLRTAKTLHRQLAEQARREGVSLNQFCGLALARSAGYPTWAPEPTTHLPVGRVYYAESLGAGRVNVSVAVSAVSGQSTQENLSSNYRTLREARRAPLQIPARVHEVLQ